MDQPTYKIMAIRYATKPERTAGSNFLFPDDHDAPMPIDYYVWAITGGGRTIVVDTGFSPATAAKRGSRLLRTTPEALKLAGIDAAAVKDVILTHLHYDHAGCMDAFPAATFHLQDAEMAYATGRCMCHPPLRFAMDVDDVCTAVRNVFADRVRFHTGTGTVAPGITLHLVGGHTGGLQVVRVPTARGHVVLASDAAHFYANMKLRNPFPLVVDIGRMMDGWRICEELADGPDHIIPGHDPLVLQRFPKAPDQPEIALLHMPPLA